MVPSKASVVIVGGGALGTSSAFHLADEGIEDVVLLDKGPIAQGTTPFAAGQTGYLTVDQDLLKLNQYCIEFFERFEERTGYPICFHQNGSLRIALTDSFRGGLEDRIKVAKETGDEAELISHERVMELVPELRLPSDASVLLIPRDGFVEPKSVAVAYAAAARARGVSIHTGCAVTGLEITDGRIHGVRTAEGFIESQWVVLAAGAWARQFAGRLELELKTVPVRHQAFVTSPITGVTGQEPVVRFAENQIYIRPYERGLLVGGYGYRPLSFDMNQFPEDFEIASLEADPIYYQQLKHAASEYFPVLKNSVTVQERRGLPTIAPDGRFVASKTSQVEGLLIASACMVGGIFASPVIGRAIVDTILDRDSELPLESLNADRFGSNYASDADLRATCESLYANHYRRES